MTLGAVVIAGVTMYAEVELGAMLNDRFIERGENEVILIIHIRNRHDQ